MTEVIEEVIHKGAEALLKNRSITSTAAFVIMDGEGGIIKHSYSGACHAGLCLANGGSVCVISSLQYPDRRKKYPEGFEERWLDYLMNRSPFSDYFIEKDAKAAIEKSYVVVTSEAPSNLMAAALVCTRHLWEKPYSIYGFNKLLRFNCQEDMAFLFSIASKFSTKSIGANSSPDLYYPNGTNEPRELVWSPTTVCGQGHKPLTPYSMYMAGVKAFLDKTPFHKNANYSKNTNYSGLDKAWTPGARDKKYGEFHGIINREYRYGELKMEYPLNIFASALEHKEDDIQYDPADLAAEKLAKISELYLKEVQSL